MQSFFENESEGSSLPLRHTKPLRAGRRAKSEQAKNQGQSLPPEKFFQHAKPDPLIPVRKQNCMRRQRNRCLPQSIGDHKSSLSRTSRRH